MTVKELSESSEYEQLDVLIHTDVKKFVLRELHNNKRWLSIAKMYQGASLLLFGFLLLKAFIAYTHTQSEINFIWMAWGIAFSFSFLIVIHEVIHYLAYRAVGARNVSFGMEFKKFLFYVQADKEIMNYHQIRIVALAPLVIVAIVTGVAAMMQYAKPLYFFYLTIFSFHSLFCAGDMGMLSYFENRKEDEILTYDDKERRKSYFYRKINHKTNENA